MRPTGMSRRIDPLGRVVIPKEMRRSLRIEEGDALNFYYDQERSMLGLKKEEVSNDYEKISADIADSISESLDLDILVAKSDYIVEATGSNRTMFIGKEMKSKFVSFSVVDLKNGDEFFENHKTTKYSKVAVSPIFSGGMPLGYLIAMVKKGQKIDSSVEKVLTVGASFFKSSIK